MVNREGAYQCATTAIPSFLQVAITRSMNVDKLPGKGQAGKVVSMLAHPWFAARMTEGLLRSRPQQQI
jgi:hypothetical protein